MTGSDSIKRPVTTAQTTFEILEQINEDDGGTPTSLARKLPYSKSTIHRYLVTLEQKNYLKKDDGSYLIGLKFLEFGEQAKKRIPLDHITPKVDNLAEETDQAVWFLTEESGYCVHIYGAFGAQSIVSGAYPGNHSKMHSLASGKAILSEYSMERVNEIIDEHGLEERTTHTITTREEFHEELERIRDEGVAYNIQESTEGLCCLSAPIKTPSEVIGAISIICPATRFKQGRMDNEFKEVLLDAVNEIEINLKFG